MGSFGARCPNNPTSMGREYPMSRFQAAAAQVQARPEPSRLLRLLHSGQQHAACLNNVLCVSSRELLSSCSCCCREDIERVL